MPRPRAPSTHHVYARQVTIHMVRVAAIEIAKSSKLLRRRYDESDLLPEVAAELQGILRCYYVHGVYFDIVNIWKHLEIL